VSAIPALRSTFSARQVFNETSAQLDDFALMNCPVVALNVFYSTVLTRFRIFLQLWTALS